MEFTSAPLLRLGFLAKAADFILSKMSTQLSDPTSLLLSGHRRPFVGDKAIGTSVQPLTLSNSKVNNEWN